MVVQIVNVKGVTVRESENDSPICAYRHRPKAFQLAFEQMLAKAWHVHISYTAGCVEPRENITQLLHMFANYASLVVVFI